MPIQTLCASPVNSGVFNLLPASAALDLYNIMAVDEGHHVHIDGPRLTFADNKSADLEFACADDVVFAR